MSVLTNIEVQACVFVCEMMNKPSKTKHLIGEENRGACVKTVDSV